MLSARLCPPAESKSKLEASILDLIARESELVASLLSLCEAQQKLFRENLAACDQTTEKVRRLAVTSKVWVQVLCFPVLLGR